MRRWWEDGLIKVENGNALKVLCGHSEQQQQPKGFRGNFIGKKAEKWRDIVAYGLLLAMALWSVCQAFDNGKERPIV